MKQILTALAVTCVFGLTGLGLSSAEAGGYGSGYSSGYASYHAPAYKPHCYYKTITTYVYKQVPVVKYVTAYYPCGTPYKVKKVFYKRVSIPVTKRVKVCH